MASKKKMRREIEMLRRRVEALEAERRQPIDDKAVEDSLRRCLRLTDQVVLGRR